MSSPTIEVKGLTKRFGSTESVSDLTFDVHPGRVTGLLGPNGAGKSTTIRMVLGLTAPSAGSVKLLGADPRSRGDLGRLVGASMEGGWALPGMSARRDLATAVAALGVTKTRAAEVLQLVGFDERHLNKPIGKFSTGMRQRYSLAVALLGDPKIIVLDEPTNGLDPQGITWLRGALREFSARGMTVVVSSHMLSEVEQIVDDVVVLNRNLKYAGPLRDIPADGETLEEKFFQLVGGI